MHLISSHPPLFSCSNFAMRTLGRGSCSAAARQQAGGRGQASVTTPCPAQEAAARCSPFQPAASQPALGPLCGRCVALFPFCVDVYDVLEL